MRPNTLLPIALGTLGSSRWTGFGARSLLALMIVGVVLALQTGCATVHSRISVSTPGVMDIAADRATAERAEALAVPPEDITVIAGTTPEGIDLLESGTKIVVLPGYEQRYRVLGTADVGYSWAMSKAFVNNMYGAWKYDDSFRKAYCYPQVPLKIVTLGLWWMVPINYPCLGTVPRKEEMRQQEMVDDLKRAAAAMGGNLVVVTAAGSVKTTTTNQYGRELSSSVTPHMGLTAFVLEVVPVRPQPSGSEGPI
jgi:hypothetical protein